MPALRTYTNLETLLPLLKAQIAVTNNILDPSRVFTSLAEDKDLMRRAPGDRFLAIKPTTFPVWEDAVTGGGNDVLWIDGELEITLFLRYGVDQSFADDAYLFDPSNGILPLWSSIITAVQLFDPTNASGVALLAEPMRLAPPGFKNMNTVHGNMAEWGRLKSWWEMKFLQLNA